MVAKWRARTRYCVVVRWRDGVPLFRSSSFSMWPLHFKINELPLRLRNNLNNKILGGVWFGSKKPAVNAFLNL